MVERIPPPTCNGCIFASSFDVRTSPELWSGSACAAATTSALVLTRSSSLLRRAARRSAADRACVTCPRARLRSTRSAWSASEIARPALRAASLASALHLTSSCSGAGGASVAAPSGRLASASIELTSEPPSRVNLATGGGGERVPGERVRPRIAAVPPTSGVSSALACTEAVGRGEKSAAAVLHQSPGGGDTAMQAGRS